MARTSKDVTPPAAAPRAHALLNRLLAISVVDLFLLGVLQHIVGLAELLELLGIATLQKGERRWRRW